MKSGKLVVGRGNQLHKMRPDQLGIFSPERALQIRVHHALRSHLCLYVVINQFRVILGSHTRKRFPLRLGNTQSLKGILDFFRNLVPASLHFCVRADIGNYLIHIQPFYGWTPVRNFFLIINLKRMQPEIAHPVRIVFFL